VWQIKNNKKHSIYLRLEYWRSARVVFKRCVGMRLGSVQHGAVGKTGQTASPKVNRLEVCTFLHVQSYGASPADAAIWDHTVSPATRLQVNAPSLNPRSICLPRRDERLSWLGWLVTYRDGLFNCPTVTHWSSNRARRRSTLLINTSNRHHLAFRPTLKIHLNENVAQMFYHDHRYTLPRTSQ